MFTKCYPLFLNNFCPTPSFYTIFSQILDLFFKILLIDDLLLLKVMGKTKHKISNLEKNKKYKLQTVLDIIMTLDYSNTSSSSDVDFKNDTTFNSNSTDSEYSSEGNEIITPPLNGERKLN